MHMGTCTPGPDDTVILVDPDILINGSVERWLLKEAT